MTSNSEYSSLPDGVEMDYTNDQFIIRRSWYSPLYYFLAIVCVALLATMFLVGSSKWDDGVFFQLLITACGAVWLFFAYYTLCGFFNMTEVTVDGHQLEVRTRPIKWFGDRKLDPAMIEKLSVEKKVTRSDNFTKIDYRVFARLSNGGEIKLLGSLDNEKQATFIKDKLGGVLGV